MTKPATPAAPEETSASDSAADELVRFFRALPRDARAEYERLADLDRRFGEDFGAEDRAR